jgi:biotin carboxylase
VECLMKNIVIVAPFLGETMIKCLQAFCNLPDIQIGLISHQPEEHCPSFIRKHICAHYKVNNALDPIELGEATTVFKKEWSRIDALIGYLEHLQGPLAEVRSKLNIPGMKSEVANNFRDKNKMKQVLHDSGLPIAKQSKINSIEDVHAFIDSVGYPIILKPLAGVGSKNTFRVMSEKDLYSVLNQLMPSPSNPVQAENFIQGEEHTLESVCINGTVIWQSSTYYLPGPLKVLENPWMQYCVLLPKEQSMHHVKEFSTINKKALSALGMQTGLSHMEWFLQESGKPIISEVGARPPGVNIMPMMEAAHEVNIWEMWAKLMVYSEWNMPKRKYAVGCAFLRGQGRGNMITKIHGLPEAQEAISGMVHAARLPQIGQLRSSHYEGDGWVILKGKTTKEVVSGLRNLLTKLVIELG